MIYLTLLSDSKTCYVTQIFGSGHLGTDIQFYPLYYSNLYFPKSGVIYSTSIDKSYGLHYGINCDDGTQYRMAHLHSLSKISGQSVEAGEFAGLQGNTGNTSGETGIHLHLEYFINGSRVSPQPLMGFPDTVGSYELDFSGTFPPKPQETLSNKFKLWKYTNRRYRR